MDVRGDGEKYRGKVTTRQRRRRHQGTPREARLSPRGRAADWHVRARARASSCSTTTRRGTIRTLPATSASSSTASSASPSAAQAHPVTTRSREGGCPRQGPRSREPACIPRRMCSSWPASPWQIGLRVLWGYLHREGHRKGEAFLLTWSATSTSSWAPSTWMRTRRCSRASGSCRPASRPCSGRGSDTARRFWERQITGDTPVFFACDERPLGRAHLPRGEGVPQQPRNGGHRPSALFANSGNRARCARMTRARPSSRSPSPVAGTKCGSPTARATARWRR